MKSRKSLFIILFGLVFAIAGCRTAPPLNIEAAPINTNVKVSTNDIKKTIIRAGVGLGWQMKVIASGHIQATLLLRKHVAKVDITFDKKSYNIRYKDSSGLDYNGETIHSNYNGWIMNLDRAIQSHLTGL